MPNGFHGVWMAVILGILSFNGIEVIAVTAGETANPTTAIPAALKTMALRLFIFYILALTVVVTFVPWTVSGSSIMVESPFVSVLRHSGVWQAAGIMNFVILAAALSTTNTNVYLCSRMLFSLSRGGYAPKAFGRLTEAGTPLIAIMASGIFIIASAFLSKFTPKAYTYLIGVALFGAIVVWMTIIVSHLSFRRRHAIESLPVRMPFFPYLQIAGLLLLGSVLLTMAFDADWRISWLCGVPWLAFVTVAYLLWGRGKDVRMGE